MRILADDPPPDGGGRAAALRAHLFAGASACSPQAAAVAEALVGLTGLTDAGAGGHASGGLAGGLGAAAVDGAGPADGADGPGGGGLPGGLVAGAALADDLVVLARAIHVLEAETGLRAAAADRIDATATGVRATLRDARMTRSHASALLEAGGLVEDHPDLVALWRTGQAATGQLATVAVRTRALTRPQRSAVVDTLTPYLSDLTAADTRTAVDAAVDALRPRDAEKREKFEHGRRYLTHSTYGEHVLIEARLPLLEGKAFLAAVDAHAAKLRVEGDRLTKAQRRADGISALVAAAAAAHTTPTSGGLPAAVTITIPLDEADRLTGHPHHSRGDDGHGRGSGSSGHGGGPTGCGCGGWGCPGSGAAGGGRPDNGGPDSGGDSRGLPGAAGGGWGSGPGTAGDNGGSSPPDDSDDLLLPIRPHGRIDHTGTLGHAAGRFLMCCAPLTGVLVDHPPGSTPLAALLGAAREEPLAVGRAQRLATTAQRKALAVRDKGCVIPGCAIPARECQPHHTTDWAHGGATDLDQLALLCWAHHRQVDLGRWNLVRNPEPHGPHWTITPTPRHTWRRRE